ncbi:MAG: hypothetical protein ATN35_06465 [Epulopiscium sp. Nele67-Bin004]|nr:MAG: hypothetical protein ATN35_06465 [Epulopiscium sp. Nele67-Bin004]
MQGIFNNEILIAAALSWFIAQMIKLVLTLFNEKKLDLSKLTSSGGMPSSHSSLTVALAVGIGQAHGYDSTLFAIGFVFSAVVMYDAANVRLQAGNHAILLNKILEQMKDHTISMEFTLKELLGHTPIQVLAGAILGAVVALMYVPV